jgi:hypothetical protein
MSLDRMTPLHSRTRPPASTSPTPAASDRNQIALLMSANTGSLAALTAIE